jgi:hypothetical protein
MKQKRRCTVKDVTAYRGPECGTDHYMVKTKIICPIQKRIKRDKMNWTKKLKQKSLNINYTYFMMKV